MLLRSSLQKHKQKHKELDKVPAVNEMMVIRRDP